MGEALEIQRSRCGQITKLMGSNMERPRRVIVDKGPELDRSESLRYYVSRRTVLCLWAGEVEATRIDRCTYVSRAKTRRVEEGESWYAAWSDAANLMTTTGRTRKQLRRWTR